MHDPEYLESVRTELTERLAMVEDFHYFAVKAWPILEGGQTFQDGWCFKIIAEHLEELYHGRINRLLINLPPRLGKSSLCSVLFPVWCWLNNPAEQFMCVSYSEKLSMRDNVRARRLIRSEWFQDRFGELFNLSDDQDTKIRVDNMQGGYRVVTSVTGTVLGEGANIIICDDINESANASETSLQSALDFFTQVLPTRFNNFKTGRMVVVQQRLDERDVSGHILATDKEGWVCLILPMEFELGRRCKTVPLKSTDGVPWCDPRLEEGELLVPSRIGPVELKRLKFSLASEYACAGQLQQRPAPLEGGIIKRKWIKVWQYPEPPVVDYVLQSWDTAMTDGKHSAYTAVTTWGVFKDDQGIPNIMLLSAFRKKMEFPELYEAMLRMSRHYLDFNGDIQNAAKTKRFKPDIILVEDKASGVTLIQQLRRLGIDVVKFNPNKFGDKINRVRRITHLIEAGRLWVPGMAPDYKRLRPFADMMVENLVNFPNAETRDVTDTVAQALLRLSTSGWVYHPLDLDATPVKKYAGEDDRPPLY